MHGAEPSRPHGPAADGALRARQTVRDVGAAGEGGMTVAALYVDPRGCYANLPDVELWDEARDARRYRGPWRVVAHPPCARWCQLSGLAEARTGRKRGDDGGCFWVVADWEGGWTCQVEQGRYGHRARKSTWLYAVDCVLPSLDWRGVYMVRTWARSRGVKAGREGTASCELQSRRERNATPEPFRDVLLDMARGAASERRPVDPVRRQDTDAPASGEPTGSRT